LGFISWLRHLFSSLVTSQLEILSILVRNYFLNETLCKEKEGGASQASAPTFGFLEEIKTLSRRKKAINY
jgi:hypothetical protein